MKKRIAVILIIVLISPILYWGISLAKCEFLTGMYGKYFTENYRENTMIGEIDYLKVLDYSDSLARVYYVTENNGSGEILVFSKENDVWVYKEWEKTVWATMGSADDIMWPYWWHAPKPTL